jgi:acetyl esterase
MTTTTTTAAPVLEPAAQAFAEATANPPFLSDLPPSEGRALLDEVQSGEIAKPDVDEEWVTVAGGPTGAVKVRIVKPRGATGTLPVVLYIHGAGWVFGDAHTHDRLVRELAVGVGAAVVFPEYDRSPEVRYPVAIEQSYAVARWVVEDGDAKGLDAARFAVAGDSVGGNMAAALTLMAKDRREARRAGALLPRHRRQLRHHLVRAVRRGLLPAPRRDAVVLGPVHHRRGAAQRDHRLTAARPASSSPGCRPRS